MGRGIENVHFGAEQPTEIDLETVFGAEELARLREYASGVVGDVDGLLRSLVSNFSYQDLADPSKKDEVVHFASNEIGWLYQ